MRGTFEGELVSFRFKKASCVVVGTFNMYIVQPAWLAKIGIIPQGIQVGIASRVDQPGFRYISPKLHSRWFVSPSKIEVEAEDPDEDCGGTAAKVLTALPWTPLTAIGNNTVYVASLEELKSLPDVARCRVPVPSGYDLAQTSLHYGLKEGDRVFNLQLSMTEEEIELSANVHTDLVGRDSEYAQAAARRFLQDRKDAEALIKHLFKTSIDYAARDDEPAKGVNGAKKGSGL